MAINFIGLLTSNATPLSALTSNTAALNGFTSNTLSLSELSGSVLGSTNISRDIGNYFTLTPTDSKIVIWKISLNAKLHVYSRRRQNGIV